MTAESGILIRRAEPEDQEAIQGMLGRLAAFEGAATAPRLGGQAMIADVFGPSPLLHIFVAFTADMQYAGFISAFENYSSWQGKPGIHIGDLWVEAAYRGHGVGKGLMAHVLAVFPERRVDVYVVRTNEARKFYERLGFQEQQNWCLYRLEYKP